MTRRGRGAVETIDRLREMCDRLGKRGDKYLRRAVAAEARFDADTVIIRDILVALCERDGLSLDSEVDPGTPARNYELALRLGIGRVFKIGDS